MSLINQMLRDLKDQKGRSPQSRQGLKPKTMKRVPYLPLPLVLGVAGIVFIFLIWWLAGILSETMFGFEPVENRGSQQVATKPQGQAEPGQVETPLPMPVVDQLTLEERMAEPVESGQEKAESAPTRQAEPEKSVAATPEKLPKPAMAKRTPSAKTVVANKVVTAKRVEKKQVRQSSSVPIRTQTSVQAAPVAAKIPARLHPDDLPGAVSSVKKNEDFTTLIDRPDRSQKSTPYGMAEEAYLDGLWALDQKQDSLAMKALQKALDIYPGHLQAREVLVETLDKSGQSGEAILLLKEGLEIAPDYMEFKKRYATLMVKQGDYDAAIKALLRNGMPGVEEDPEAHTLLASLYQKLGEFFLAAQTYRNLIVAWPQTGAFWVGLGSALEGQNLVEEAAECYERALNTANLRDDLNDYARRRLRSLR